LAIKRKTKSRSDLKQSESNQLDEMQIQKSKSVGTKQVGIKKKQITKKNNKTIILNINKGGKGKSSKKSIENESTND
jgi:hypothetical protein